MIFNKRIFLGEEIFLFKTVDNVVTLVIESRLKSSSLNIYHVYKF